MNTLRILGIRGIPAAHGGFETFAEKLALYLCERGWKVIVYCQEDGEGPAWDDEWRGIQRVHIPVTQRGALGTILFDWKSTMHAARQKHTCLTLGYNTAVFTAVLRAKGIPNVINMDGIEWSRAKWGPMAKAWFWLNERAGCWLGTKLIADHPEIKRHLSSGFRGDPTRIEMIPYGADDQKYVDQTADSLILKDFGLWKNGYMTVIARPEPENSLLEIVKAFSMRERRCKLVVLGNYDASNHYHQRVIDSAGGAVIFLGAIYDQGVVSCLRRNCLAYIHGHQVGGTNPSLVEALGAGNPIVAHANRFNAWVTQDAALYFENEVILDEQMTKLIDSSELRENLGTAGRKRFLADLTWPSVLQRYESLLLEYAQEG